MSERFQKWTGALLGAVFVLVVPTAAAAQAKRTGPSSTARKWEVEGHAGGAFGNRPGSVTQMPAAGPAFATFNNFPTQMVPSWYFGDGTRLFNDATATRFTARLSALDPVFTTSSVGPARGGNFGVRVGRILSNRLTAEFSLDVKPEGLAFTNAAADAIERSRSSFQTVFDAMLPSSGRVVTSIKTVSNATGQQLLAIGAVNIRLRTRGRLVPHVSVGAGVLSQRGALPEATLTGDYRFVSGSSTTYRQVDAVSLTIKSDPVPALLLGGGVRRGLTARSGIRADVAAYVSPNHLTLLLDATPRTIAGTTPNAFTFSSGISSPAIQVSTMPAFESSLSGPAISKYEVASGRGTQIHATVGVGYYWRF